MLFVVVSCVYAIAFVYYLIIRISMVMGLAFDLSDGELYLLITMETYDKLCIFMALMRR